MGQKHYCFEKAVVMPVCNIDTKGRIARLVWGLLCLTGGAVLALVWAIPGGGWPAWTVTGVAFAMGGLGIYSACTGWCLTRALGFKTPM